MSTYWNGRSVGLALLLPVLLAACETPTSFRPEAEAFAKATAEAEAYLIARKAFADQQQQALRQTILTRDMPKPIFANTGCSTALDALNIAASSPTPAPLSAEVVAGCDLQLPEGVNTSVFRSADRLTASVAFMQAVERYAASLMAITGASDQAGFVKAATDTADALTSAAVNAARAGGVAAPDTAALGPIAALIANAAYYHLENKRAEALRDAAESAKPWIDLGVGAVSRVMVSLNFEEATLSLAALNVATDAVNAASGDAYPPAAATAIARLDDLRATLGADPTQPLKALATAHDALLEAFRDRERNVETAIAAAQRLYQLAKGAREAIEARGEESGS